jgi:hypothetical protein
MNVPSTHDPNNIDPPNKEKEPMATQQIIENNPFPVRKEGEPLKLTIKTNKGELEEFNLWYADRSPAEMSSMDLVKAICDAIQVKNKISKIEWELTKIKLMETGDYAWDEVQDIELLALVDDNFLDCRNAIDKFLDEACQIKWDAQGEMNFNPSFAKSFRAWADASENPYNRITGVNIIMNEVLMEEISFKSSDVVVTEGENGEFIYDIPGSKTGYVISFKSYTCNEKGQHYVRVWPGAMYLNKTANGYRVMWKNKKTGAGLFGMTYSSMSRQKLVPKDNGVYYIVDGLVKEIIEPEDILPILKWIEKDIQDNGVHSHPYGISARDIYWIGGETSIKKILNKAYKHDHGVTKKMFGDINSIKSLRQLRGAIALVQVGRGFNPQVFEKLSLNTVTEVFAYDTTRVLKEFKKFFEFFGSRERFMLEIFSAQNETWANTYLISDSVGCLRMIRSPRHRAAIKAHVAHHKMNLTEIHDYLVAEATKVKHENAKFKNTTFHKKFNVFNNKEVAPGITVVVPTQTHDLVEWGAAQSNCIGNYGDDVLNNRCMILGFKDENNNWIGHAQINHDMRLHQLLGKHNRSLGTLHRDQIVKFLINEFEVDATSYWGED